METEVRYNERMKILSSTLHLQQRNSLKRHDSAADLDAAPAT